MLRLTSERQGPLSEMIDDGWERFAPRRRPRPEGPPVGWLVAGVAVVGLGVLAWSYLGPDLKRYMKIHSM
jgi:hypothetical protein